MKVLHVFTHDSITRGGAVQGLLLAKRQYQKGFKVACLFHKPFGEKGLTSEEFPFEVFSVNMKNPLSYLWFARWLKQNLPDVIHCHRNLALLFSYFSLYHVGWFIKPKPVLIINRGTVYDLPNLLVRRIFRSPRLSHVIAVSEAVKKHLVEKEDITPEKITVVYGSYDEEVFNPDVDGSRFRDELGIEKDKRVILCLAAVDKRKGLEYLARAVRKVIDEMGNVIVLSVGHIEDEAYYNKVREEIHRLGLGEVFRFVGHRKDVPEVIASCDVSVSASIEGEGLTGAIRESLAMMKPVVATSVAGNPEIVIDGKTGWLVPPRDPEKLARSIIEALRNVEEAKIRAYNGYKLVKELCSSEKRFEKVMGIYESLRHRKGS